MLTNLGPNLRQQNILIGNKQKEIQQQLEQPERVDKKYKPKLSKPSATTEAETTNIIY